MGTGIHTSLLALARENNAKRKRERKGGRERQRDLYKAM